MPTTQSEFAVRAERHRRELHVHCYRMMGSFEEAEDAVQETLLRAWRYREDLDRAEWFRAWLYRIATNTCLDAIKAKKRKVATVESVKDIPWLQPYPDELLEEAQVAPESEEPGEAIVERETIELTFLAVIQLLPPSQRAVLILRQVVDWPAADVAEILELSVPAVNSALQRARETLRDHLPSERREEWSSREVTETERSVLEGFMRTHESGDVDAAMEMIREDIRVTMPPHPWLFAGIEEVRGLMERANGPDSPGEWRLVPVRANRMPAAASYLKAHGDTEFRAFKFDLLRIVDGKIAEITTFGSELFPAFGLPDVLAA